MGEFWHGQGVGVDRWYRPCSSSAATLQSELPHIAVENSKKLSEHWQCSFHASKVQTKFLVNFLVNSLLILKQTKFLVDFSCKYSAEEISANKITDSNRTVFFKSKTEERVICCMLLFQGQAMAGPLERHRNCHPDRQSQTSWLFMALLHWVLAWHLLLPIMSSLHIRGCTRALLCVRDVQERSSRTCSWKTWQQLQCSFQNPDSHRVRTELDPIYFSKKKEKKG